MNGRCRSILAAPAGTMLRTSVSRRRERTVVLTSYPASSNCAMVCAPRNPEPPVTRTVSFM
jgi:hypothetical protein